MATARTYAKNLRETVLASNNEIGATNAAAVVVDESTRYLTWPKVAADGAANTATAESPVFAVKRASRLKSFDMYGAAAIAADNTDYVTITLRKRTTADPATQVTIATYDSRAANNGATVAWTKMAFTLSVVAGAIDLAVGDLVTIEIAKAASGKVVPISTFVANFEEI